MSQVIRFDCFEVDLDAGILRKRGARIRLRDQPFQVLASLLEHSGQVVTRDELRRRLWRDDVFVDFDNCLNIAIARLRTALGDSAERPRFIETLPKRGYRFIGKVSPLPPAAGPGLVRRPRLVVLPFLNLSGDAAQEYFSDAMTDELITVLANLAPEQLAVIARTTAMHYKGSRKDVARIGREIGVDYVVEGALHHTEEQVAVNVQLIQTGDQAHLFARRYKAELRDIFRMQSSIAQDIAAHIPSTAGKARGEQVTRKPSENLAAYNEYIKGRYEMWKWTPESVAKAKQHFETALAWDPRFALACDALANLYGYLGMWGFLPPNEMEPLRWFYGLRAFELDPMLAEPRTHVAYHPEKTHHEDAYSYNWLEAERDMACARDLNPNSPIIRVRHSTVLLVLGNIEEAVAELQRALEFDPLSPEVRFWLAWVLFCGRQYEQALMQARKLVELEPEQHFAYMVLGLACLGMQRFEESVAAHKKAAELSGEFPLVLGWLGLTFGLGGYTEEARGVLARLRVIGTKRFVLPTSFAWLHLGLGEIDDAFALMEQAVHSNDEWIHPLRTYPFLDPLRSDPRFRVLMRKLSLE
jgi:TolB-like protein/DNA-binding winged helix-turn-helix (wHTH) protein/Flp pilus assembly protein TadD